MGYRNKKQQIGRIKYIPAGSIDYQAPLGLKTANILSIDTLVPSLRALNCVLPFLPLVSTLCVFLAWSELGIALGVHLGERLRLGQIPSEQLDS